MRNEILALINMQKLDDKISELDILKVQKPQQLNHLISTVEKANTYQKQVEKKIEENSIEQKNKENEILSNKEMMRKYGTQLDGIKKNEEYKALNKQISFLDERNKEIETEILKFMEIADELKNQLKEAQKLKKQADDNLKKNEVILNNEIKKVDEDIDRLKQNRVEYAKQIPESLVKKYVQLIKNKNRKAVVYNNNSACSGCGFHIRPQILIELNTPDKIHYCENCGRILVKTFE
jgi:predicted  nucleic acid-binding Zn-ribbon protein